MPTVSPGAGGPTGLGTTQQIWKARRPIYSAPLPAPPANPSPQSIWPPGIVQAEAPPPYPGAVIATTYPSQGLAQPAWSPTIARAEAPPPDAGAVIAATYPWQPSRQATAPVMVQAEAPPPDPGAVIARQYRPDRSFASAITSAMVQAEAPPPHPGAVIVQAHRLDHLIALAVSTNAHFSTATTEVHTFALSVSAGVGLRPQVSALFGTDHLVSVSTNLGVRPAITLAYVTPIVVSVSSGLGLQATTTEYVSPIRLSVSSGLFVHVAAASEEHIDVAAGLGIQAAVTAYISPIRLSVSSGLGLRAAATAFVTQTLDLSVSSGLVLTPSVVAVTNRVIVLSVSSGLGLAALEQAVDRRLLTESVSSGLILTPSLVLAANRLYSITVSAGLVLTPSVAASGLHRYALTVSAGLNLRPSAAISVAKVLTVSAGLSFSASIVGAADRDLSVSTGFDLRPIATSGREVELSVSADLAFASPLAGASDTAALDLDVTLSFEATASLTIGPQTLEAGLILTPSVACEHITAQGIPAVGPDRVLYSGLSGRHPLTFAETPSGVVLMANGVDPMIRWQMGRAAVAGVLAPATAPVGTASGLGTITGARYLFCRFLDEYGNPSNLSPAGVVQCGSDRSIDDIAFDATSGLVTILARDHGLTNGQSILLAGITGLPLNGQFSVIVIDQDRFSLQGVTLSGGVWLGNGTVVSGAASLTYSAIPVPTQSKVVAIQFLRNLEGNLDVLYVDGLMTPGTTSYTSIASDIQLAQRPAVVVRAEDGTPLGMRYGVPPSNRPFLANYMGRIFAAGDLVYSDGNVQVTNGSDIIQGWGTQWPSSLTNRSIYVKGASSVYAIASVDPISQAMRLTATWSGSASLFATYSVRSSPADRKMLQWSEPDLAEAWPAWNALAIPEDNDEITGLFVRGTYLYLTERRHLWRFQFNGDPASGGHVFLQAQRGAINHRCIANADDATFILDEVGIYAFEGQGVEPIDRDIQAVFWPDGLAPTYRIDWSADRTLWHASVERLRTTVRWFIHVVGVDGLTTALCYNYRLQEWWWEQYPVQVTSSCEGTLGEAADGMVATGCRRALAGSDGRIVLVLGQGVLDLAEDTGTLRGTVGTASSAGLTDLAASFGVGLSGVPVTIVSGSAASGQTRLISAAAGTSLSPVRAFDPIPQPGDVYQIGGVSWQWRSGWLDVEDEEGDTTRDLVVSFQAVVDPATMSMQVYYDHSATPLAWGLAQSYDGVTTAEGDPHIWFDLSSIDVLPGYRVFRIARHSERYAYSDRFVQMFLSGVQNDETVRVYQVSLRGVDQEGV